MPATAKKQSAEELTKKWEGRTIPHFKILSVKAVNFRPHPFMIGPQHFPGPHEGIYIIPEKAPCAMRGCGRMIHEHTHDTVMLLQLTENITNKQAQDALKPLCDEMTADGIDGFAFVETVEKFQIT